ERGERIDRTAARQIRRRKRGPAHRRIGEVARALADHELLIKALLADLDVEDVAELLLIPELPQPQRRISLEAADGLNGQDVGGVELAAPDVESADVEETAGEAEQRLRVPLQLAGRDAIALEALTDAAGDVAERLHLLEELQGDPVFGERRPDAAEVAEQGWILPIACQNAEGLVRSRSGVGGCGVGLIGQGGAGKARRSDSTGGPQHPGERLFRPAPTGGGGA